MNTNPNNDGIILESNYSLSESQLCEEARRSKERVREYLMSMLSLPIDADPPTVSISSRNEEREKLSLV